MVTAVLLAHGLIGLPEITPYLQPQPYKVTEAQGLIEQTQKELIKAYGVVSLGKAATTTEPKMIGDREKGDRLRDKEKVEGGNKERAGGIDKDSKQIPQVSPYA